MAKFGNLAGSCEKFGRQWVNHIFALIDEELGETGLVKHVIDTEKKATITSPRRLF